MPDHEFRSAADQFVGSQRTAITAACACGWIGGSFASQRNARRAWSRHLAHPNKTGQEVNSDAKDINPNVSSIRRRLGL